MSWLHLQRKLYRKWYLLLGLLLVYPFLLQFYGIQEFILAETFVALLWYAKETYDIKQNSNKQIKEARKQTYLNTRPFMRINWDNDEHKAIFVVNEGGGVAVDLTIEFLSDNKVKEAQSRPVMSTGPQSVTRIDYRDFGLTDGTFNEQFSPLKNQYEISMKYKDLVNNSYEQVFNTDASYNDRYKVIEWDIPEDFKKMQYRMLKIKNNRK
ncbi:hypothetical protein HY857_00940 [Candidatus Saccharibacteria bacterium]|nr:hypothetical protein [Candidatus Saccharibacteria bacterium]